ncbi:cyclic nucleotide-binding domain-containing protein, partial [Candidatus Woesearchaeota archaeon]|nr:cyclic nucleotide-binding domain-containing protein [Candidatus Woesearchaeota archaeon]
LNRDAVPTKAVKTAFQVAVEDLDSQDFQIKLDDGSIVNLNCLISSDILYDSTDSIDIDEIYRKLKITKKGASEWSKLNYIKFHSAWKKYDNAETDNNQKYYLDKLAKSLIRIGFGYYLNKKVFSEKTSSTIGNEKNLEELRSGEEYQSSTPDEKYSRFLQKHGKDVLPDKLFELIELAEKIRTNQESESPDDFAVKARSYLYQLASQQKLPSDLTRVINQTAILDFYTLREFEQISYQNEKKLIKKKDDSNGEIYFILDGEVEVDFVVNNQKKTAIKTAGETFGELGAIMGINRTANVTVKEDTTLIKVDYNRIKNKINSKFINRIDENDILSPEDFAIYSFLCSTAPTLVQVVSTVRPQEIDTEKAALDHFPEGLRNLSTTYGNKLVERLGSLDIELIKGENKKIISKGNPVKKDQDPAMYVLKNGTFTGKEDDNEIFQYNSPGDISGEYIMPVFNSDEYERTSDVFLSGQAYKITSSDLENILNSDPGAYRLLNLFAVQQNLRNCKLNYEQN